jgi:hypothetical protein
VVTPGDPPTEVGDARIERLAEHLADVGGWERAGDLGRWDPDIDSYVLWGALRIGVVVEGRCQKVGRGGRPAKIFGLTAWVVADTMVHGSDVSLHWYYTPPRPKPVRASKLPHLDGWPKGWEIRVYYDGVEVSWTDLAALLATYEPPPPPGPHAPPPGEPGW